MRQRAEIASIANAEPVGSKLYAAHLGLLLFAAAGALFLFDRQEFLIVYVIYAFLLTTEKLLAAATVKNEDTSAYPIILGILFLRATAFNVIVLLVWRLEGDLFKFAALALLVSATINIMVFHATYRAVMACVVAPIFAAFVAISVGIIASEGWSTTSIGAVAVTVCVVPYFALALLAAQDRWKELNSTKDALEQSQRMDAIGRVASGVSHDFNNVLSIVAGNLHLLETAGDPQERSRLLKSATEAVEGGASLSRQLLTMGKQQVLMPEAVSLDAVIDTFVVFCRNVFPASISIKVSHPTEQITIFADPNLLQSTLLNVALNAKAAMENSGELKIEYRKTSFPSSRKNGQNRCCACISLTDTGRGMNEQTAIRAFEPFFSASAAEGGSGLGLPMVKGYVEQSNGEVELTSVEGIGTTVKLYLPLASVDQNTVNEDPKERPQIQAGSQARRILLVEDNRELRRILETMIQRFGHEVTAFESADEAIDYMKSGAEFQLVLCDLDLPGNLQGDDLLKTSKSIHPRVPFILMSGFAAAEKFEDTDTLTKADLFLAKPLNLQELQQHIEKLLQLG